jgi:hypothetical protein
MNKCTGCREDFTGITNFDKHQTNVFEGRKLVVHCTPPAELGMTQNERGQWGYPGDIFTKDAPETVRPADYYDRTCVKCGTIFQRPATRGRPPTKCEDCR